MEKLFRERKSLDPRIKRVSDVVSKLEPETAEETEVQTELEVLGDIWAAYCTVHKRILDASEDDALYDDAVLQQCRFESVYINLKNRLLKVLKVIKGRDSSQEERPQSDALNQLAQQQAELLRLMASRMAAGPSTSAASFDAPPVLTPLSDLKLPRMSLPVFSGDYLEWQSFIDLFRSMVDQNPSLRDSQKLYFLKTNLSGEAASLISHLKIEDANYLPALQKLQSRYDKPLEIANKHIERFLNQPSMTSPSAQGLRSLHDVSDEVVRALQAMQREDRDMWLLFILVEKLDHETKQLWYQKIADMPEVDVTLKAFLSFIDSRSFALQSAQPIRPRAASTYKPAMKPQYRGATTFVATNTSPNCGVCDKSPHPLYQCGKFIHMSSEERLSAIRTQMLCQNCLKKHHGEACRSGNCRKCGQLHHTLLHFALTPPLPLQASSTSYAASGSDGSAVQSLISALDSTASFDASSTLLATVSINVMDKQGRPHACRAVLDSASQVSFISESFCNELGLDLLEADMDIEGISSTPAHVDKCVQIMIASRCSDFSTPVPCMVLEKITRTLPVKPANIDGWPIPKSINLADPLFHLPGKINVLLGIEPFFQLLEPGKIALGSDDNLPTLHNTKLGWVVAGRYREPSIYPYATTSTCLLTSTDSLDQQLRRFWELEEYALPVHHLSEEERQCEEHFQRHTLRDDTGKFTVRLPFLHPVSQLGDSRLMAERRLNHIERKLHRNPKLKQEYHTFLREYCELGHMTLADGPAPRDSVYLPHHCVVKEASSTTKCRVVFDASAKTTSGRSLNDVLMAGPVLQDSIVNILLRFRFPPIVITGDIKQMYRMVNIHESERDFQRILWRWSETEPVGEYRLNTVTYGTKSASYLATKCVQQLLESHKEQYPTAVEKAEKGTYVDDVLTGADTEKEAILLREQLTTIFAAGGFHLRKWASNNSAVLDGVPEEDQEVEVPIELNDNRTIKALGIHWQPCSDEFLFTYTPIKISQPTKRSMLSQIASIFDPLGLLAPIIVKAKLFMQQLWELRVDWDETLPGEFVQIWLSFVQNLSDLQYLQVPRRVIGIQSAARVHLHGYSDASERAMGACVYIRAADEHGNTSSHLLCAKSKTAPIGNGRTTLPRLELCAAVMLARLLGNVMEAITIPINEVQAFSDSTVALAWIHGGASRWKTFVANRVAEITTHLPAVNWLHVDTHNNPADLISRGALPDQINNNPLWWHGPEWPAPQSTHPSRSVPDFDLNHQRQVEREQRSVAVVYLAVYENSFLDAMLARYYPNLQLLLRITARMLRFLHRESRLTKRLTTLEIDRAMQIYVRHVQCQHYWKEIDQLKQNNDVNRRSSLHQLKPFLDEHQLLRVGGRLQQSELSYDTKHPILLPHHSSFTSLILHHEHHEQLHCGPQSLLAAVRRKFWIVRGTSAARKICRACVKCARVRPAPLHQLMGQLPADRVKPSPPFSITGIDYAGPINVVSRRTRGAVPTKGYIALFVCFSTRAVHLEVVSDLSTSAFIGAFTRFCSRYGLPCKVYSDNATNFRGAAKKLREFYEQINTTINADDVTDSLTDKGIEWMFIPPRSPHHGGLWEAGIKVAKGFLSKFGDDARFTFEELSTILAQVAACMNSRPIAALSDDPNEAQPLTPAHFLIGRPLNIVPEINQLERRVGSLSRWEFVQRAVQEFRVRWQSEYVLSLQRMTKWQRSASNISTGDFVLLAADNEKSKQWSLGRVVDVFPGQDGHIRVVSIKTANGTTRRDVRRIRRIPLEDDEYVPGRNGAEIPRGNLVGGLCCSGM